MAVKLTEKEGKTFYHKEQIVKLDDCDNLLDGLKVLSEYYSLQLDQLPLSFKLNNLELEAIKYADALKQTMTKSEALTLMIRQLIEIDDIIKKHRYNKSALIQVLLDIQSRYRWLPHHALIWVSKRLDISFAQIYRVVTFYKAFSLIPRGRHEILVCLGTACQVRGAPILLDRVITALDILPGKTDLEQKFTLTTVNCLGCCALGPIMVIDNEYYGDPSVKEIKQITTLYK